MPCMDCNEEQTRAYLVESRAANGLPPPAPPMSHRPSKDISGRCTECVTEAFIIGCLFTVIMIAVLVLGLE